jgi:hypothetical protein
MKATAILLALASMVLLAACDPFQTPGTWRATASNDHNLRAMVADPRDLEGGAGDEGARGNAATGPVLDLLIGKRRGLGSISTEASGGSSSAGGANAAAGQP